MRKHSVSLLLVLTLIIAIGTLVQHYRFDTSIGAERERALTVERQIGAVTASLARARAAQLSYVAAGQDPDFWMTRVTDLAGEASIAIARLREGSDVTAAIERYNTADAALAEFNKVDGRVRDFVRNDQRLFASDLVFLDAPQASDKIDAELKIARDAELADSAQRIALLTNLRLAMTGSTLAGLIILAIVLRPSASVATETKPAPSTLQMLRDLPPPVKNLQPPTHAPPPVPAMVPAAAAVKQQVNLAAAAELCVDLARVIDARDVAGLVQRTATVLDAKGVVLWVADPEGLQLHPSVAHGYADKVLSRLQPLQVSGDNVTALAYRSLQPQAVSGTSPADAGAVAVPLITSSGCVGVLAAETRPNRSGQDILPLARIIAAQFASIVAPIEVAGARTAAGGATT